MEQSYSSHTAHLRSQSGRRSLSATPSLTGVDTTRGGGATERWWSRATPRTRHTCGARAGGGAYQQPRLSQVLTPLGAAEPERWWSVEQSYSSHTAHLRSQSGRRSLSATPSLTGVDTTHLFYHLHLFQVLPAAALADTPGFFLHLHLQQVLVKCDPCCSVASPACGRMASFAVDILAGVLTSTRIPCPHNIPSPTFFFLGDFSLLRI